MKENNYFKMIKHRSIIIMSEDITCPYSGESGGCDDCVLGLETMTCEEERTS